MTAEEFKDRWMSIQSLLAFLRKTKVLPYRYMSNSEYHIFIRNMAVRDAR
jgi:hypothetical protein